VFSELSLDFGYENERLTSFLRQPVYEFHTVYVRFSSHYDKAVVYWQHSLIGWLVSEWSSVNKNNLQQTLKKFIGKHERNHAFPAVREKKLKREMKWIKD
jgi:transposase-like protein